jgi:hypothetical protein
MENAGKMMWKAMVKPNCARASSSAFIPNIMAPDEGLPRYSKSSKQFFFEKKNQKTFIYRRMP